MLSRQEIVKEFIRGMSYNSILRRDLIDELDEKIEKMRQAPQPNVEDYWLQTGQYLWDAMGEYERREEHRNH